MKKVLLGIIVLVLTSFGVNAEYGDWTYRLAGLQLASFEDDASLYTWDTWAYTTDGKTATIRGFSGMWDGGTIPSSVGWFVPWPVTSIGFLAFSGQSLMSLSIPASITNIADGAFANVNILGIKIDDANPCYISTNGGLFNKSKTTLVACFHAGILDSHWIPTNVTCINSYAFVGVALNEIFIPSSVTNFGHNVFDGCVGLYNIVVDPDNPCFSSVNGVLFDKLQTTLIQVPPAGFTSYTVPDTVTRIGDGAFNGCSGLAQVTIPYSVTNIGSNVFSKCLITVDPANPRYCVTNGALFDKQQAALLRYSPQLSEPAFSIPTNTTRIESSAFAGCSQLTTIIIPNSITNIGDDAFLNCKGLTHLVLPNKLVSIGNSAFCGCTGLTNLVIPDKVTRIGSYAFYGCSSLAGITLSPDLIAIKNAAFGYCSSLKSLTIPDGLTTIGNMAFHNCNSLTNLVIGANVTNIESYAFLHSTNLAKVFFRGDAPLNYGKSSLEYSRSATVYYRPERAGWEAFYLMFATKAPWPSISVQNTPNSGMLTWTQGLLMESTDLQTWIVNTNTSPYPIQRDQPQKFYQLRLD